jgi:WD40 repeat protein
MQFSPDDNFIATGDSAGRVVVYIFFSCNMPSHFRLPYFKVWNIAEKRVVAVFKHFGIVPSLDFSPDGRFLVSGCFDSSVRIWCLRDGSSRKLLDREVFFFTSIAISGDGRYVAAADYNGMLRVWDFRSGQF